MGREQNSLADLLNTLMFVHTEADLGQSQAQKRTWNILAMILPPLIFLAAIMKPLSNVGQYFQAHDWWGLIGDILSLLSSLFLPLMIFISLKSTGRSSPLSEKVLELRRQLHDETLTPLVAEQPLPLEAGELPFTSTRIGPVRRVKGVSIFFLGMSIFFLFADVFLGAMVVATLPGMSATFELWVTLATSSLFLLCVIITALMLILAIRLLPASRVVVDEWGLRWKWPNLIKGRSVALAWPEITGFYEITSQENIYQPCKTYVLDSPTGTFTWPLRKRSTQKEQQASAYLIRLIVTRTGLSLRDLTQAVEPLLNPAPETEKRETDEKRLERNTC